MSLRGPLLTVSNLYHLQRVVKGIRTVSMWTPLAAAFNTKPMRKINFNLLRDDVGLFRIPELRDPSGFYILQQKVQGEVEKLVAEATSPNRQRKIVQIFDQLSDCLCRVADMADFVRHTHPRSSYAEAAEEACINLSGLVEKLNTNTDIHKALKNVLENGDVVPTDEVDRRVAELFMFDFQQSGIHLAEDKRKKFVELNEKIFILGTYFMRGTQQSTSVPKDQLPNNIRDCFSVDGEEVTVSGLFSDHYSDVVREAAYKIFLYPDKHQLELLDSLLKARSQLAELVGFPTYSQRAIRGTMAETRENVIAFLETLAGKLKSRASDDYSEISRLKVEHGSPTLMVHPWDPPYYTALGRHKICGINNNEVTPYLSLGCCMEGLSNLFKSLFNVTLQNLEVDHGEVWSYDIHKLAVVHETDGVLGYIYCDFFERAGKQNHDCHYTIQGGREREDGTYQLPIVVLHLNFPSPQQSVPSLLTPGMLENLFHEFGHAMHSMLGRTKYQHVTGTRCPTDFAEVPSVLMEYFVSDPRVLSTFTRHYRTGEPLPQWSIKKLCRAKKVFAASDMQLQLFYSLLDQTLHSQATSSTSTTTNILEEIQNKYYGIPYVKNTAWHLRFGHLVGYGAKYYSYLLSRAVASRIWQQCFKDNPFDRSMGEQYRQKMLAHGGGKHPTELIQGMLNETITTDKLVESLIQELDTARASVDDSEE